MKYLLLAAVLLAPPGQAWGRAGDGGGGGGGGCFPAGTPVLTVKGEVPIEKIRAGDRVLAFSNERLVEVEVKNFIEKKDRLIRIRTAGRSLTATSEHPLLTRYGFTEVRALRKGDDVALFEDGRRVWAKIRSIRPGGVAKVYNLEVSPPNTFIAGGFIVHNKGGFGGGYSGGYSSGYSSDYSGRYSGGRYRRNRFTLFDLIFFGVIALAVALKKMFFGNSYGGGSYGGYGVPGAAPARAFRGAVLQNGLVMPRAELTLDILKALARRDPAFNPVELENFARGVFLKVQAAWQARDYSALRGVMMPSIHASYSSKVDSMRVRGEVNMMEEVQVLHADFVHVRCPREKEGRAVTVLITASAKDYTINERHHNSQARPVQTETFQEYWTFHQLNGSWALARVDQIGELDYLNAPNLPSDPQGANAVPEAPAAAGAAAAADDSAYRPPSSFAPGATAGDNSFERGAEALRALAPAPAAAAAAAAAEAAALRPPQPPPQFPKKTAAQDARWDRQKMEIAATLAFESVYEAWGRGDGARLSPEFVSAEALVKLKKVMEDRKAEGLTFEFKSLFTRRAEVVLASPAEKSALHLDEFTARITATAVRALLRNGKALHRDEAPAPFTEYWVFGRQNDCWKLRDILPRMDQECEDRSKDGAPGPAQIEWYWHS